MGLGVSTLICLIFLDAERGVLFIESLESFYVVLFSSERTIGTAYYFLYGLTVCRRCGKDYRFDVEDLLFDDL